MAYSYDRGYALTPNQQTFPNLYDGRLQFYLIEHKASKIS